MDATSALVPRQTMAFSTKWQLTGGESEKIFCTRGNNFVNRSVLTTDYPALEKVSDKAVKEKQKFERLVVPKETLLEMFSVSTLMHYYKTLLE